MFLTACAHLGKLAGCIRRPLLHQRCASRRNELSDAALQKCCAIAVLCSIDSRLLDNFSENYGESFVHRRLYVSLYLAKEEMQEDEDEKEGRETEKHTRNGLRE